jgi:hypothetical protein
LKGMFDIRSELGQASCDRAEFAPTAFGTSTAG